MIRIGIVGAENTHSIAVAKTLNISKKVPGFRVVAIWGETDKFAKKAAKDGAIPTIVRKPEDMIGQIDAVFIDHRHPKYHLPAAEAFLKARIPMFIDKPFCYRLSEGKDFLARCRRAKVPVCSFSAMIMQRSFQRLKKSLKDNNVLAITSVGPCDPDSQYGGLFFYAIHQVDMIVDLIGGNVVEVNVTRTNGKICAVTTLFFRSGVIATIHCTKDHPGFHIAAIRQSGPVAKHISYDADSHITGIRTFCRMFRTGQEPLEHKRILAPIAILEAMEKSLKTGKAQPVAKV